jgi:hypothetical protein
MSKIYRHKYSAWLNLELDRLEFGQKHERQRYNNSMSAIAKVISNPLNPDFNKDLPENYKAVDVLQQYRLFFKMVTDPTIGDQVVYFVWINDETSIHRSGKSDDCYQIFREMLDRGQVEAYQPDPVLNDSYKRHSSWGDEFIYLSFKRSISSGPLQVADGHLLLSRTKDQEYFIQAISVSHEDLGLASALLENVCKDAAQFKIALKHELFIRSEHVDKSRHLLKKFGFKMTEFIDDVEIWQL